MTYTISDLPDIENQMRRIFWHWRNQDEYEDCVQEAVIRAWKDITSDEEYSDQHIINRAAQRYRAVATSDHHHYTGHPESRSGFGRTSPPLSPLEEKVRAYRHEYASLHDGYAPTPKQIAEAVGMPRWQAKNAHERVKASEQRYTSALLRIEGDGKPRLDAAAYRFVPAPAGGHDNVESTALVQAFAVPSFEDGSVDMIAFEQDLERLFPGDTRAHCALRWRHIDGLTTAEIGARLFPERKHPQPPASRLLIKLHKVWLADMEARSDG